MNSSAYVGTLEFIFTKSAQASRISVSYTHLDVYKRQILHIIKNLNFRIAL